MALLRKTVGATVAACAAIVLLAGAALAGNSNGTPPGQAKKGTTGHGNGHAVAKGHAKKANPAHPAHPAHPVTPSRPSNRNAAKVIVPPKPVFAASNGHEKTAQHKVIICHRTGSATNPYVVINISINAWQNGTPGTRRSTGGATSCYRIQHRRARRATHRSVRAGSRPAPASRGSRTRGSLFMCARRRRVARLAVSRASARRPKLDRARARLEVC